MHPVLFNSIPLYFVMWVCAAVVALTLGTVMAVRAGFPAGRSAMALTLLALSILAGSKALYLLEVHWYPLDDYVPQEMHGMLHGFRIPGGMLALAAAMPVVCGALGLSWRRFGDALIPLAAVALAFIRVGCFLNGCCFGKLSALPWAVAFPRESWVFWYQRARGWIPPDAPASLPVHPLQLYFLLAALATLAILLWRQSRAPFPGYLQLLFYAFFFGTTAALEPLRQNHLSLNSWIAPALTVVPAALLFGRVATMGVGPTDHAAAPAHAGKKPYHKTP